MQAPERPRVVDSASEGEDAAAAGVFAANIGTPQRPIQPGGDTQPEQQASSAAAASTAQAPTLEEAVVREMDKEQIASIIQALQTQLDEVKEEMKRLTKENTDLKDTNKTTDNVNLGNNLKPLLDIDRKDVEKPPKFKGDPLQWRAWTLKFKAFLARRDARWPKLIDAIQKNSQKPMDTTVKKVIFKAVNIDTDTDGGADLSEKFNDQLYEYLENFTDGATLTMIQAAGIEEVLETFRVMCDEGHSKRDRHLTKEYRLVSNPKQASFDTLRQAIAAWEKDLAEYETACGQKMDDRTRLLCLEDICPDLLQQHLASKDGLDTYAGYKAVINDYLVERKRWSSPNAKGKINWLGIQEALIEEHEEPETASTDGMEDDMENIMGEVKETLLALVKSKFQNQKRPKGGGKGKGGKTGKGKDGIDGKGAMQVDDPVCFECGEPMKICGHSAKDCPVRKARVAAGGPERVPKGGGKGGKNGKGSAWPSKTMWNNFYPGPSQAQWRGWYPQPSPGGPSGGELNLFEQPMQLSTISPLQALLNSTGTCYGIRPSDKNQADGRKTHEHTNRPRDINQANVPKSYEHTNRNQANVPKSYVHTNRYQALEMDGPSKFMTVNVLDALK